MSLRIIGAGWGRTGTQSLKYALEYLNIGKCYHMFDLIKDGSKVGHWEKLTRNEKPDYHDLFNGYQSAVSSLSACFYKELMNEYPAAKVILTIRDANDWFESGSKASFRKAPHILFLLSKFLGLFSRRFSDLTRVIKCTDDFLYRGLYKGRSHDKEFMKSLFYDWNEEVKRYVSTEKLLVYDVKEGWPPLCEFLNVPVPDIPFPKLNSREDFRKNVRASFLHTGT